MTPVKPIIANKKYSGGPNLRANLAKSGDTSKSTKTEKVPPIKLETTDTFRASPPLPCLLRG